MKALVRRLFRRKVRVYILPTRMGGYLNGLIFLMFLLSTGYSNNLLLIFTIILFAMNLMWLVQTHFHLYRLKLDGVRVMNGHVGESIPVTVRWARTPKAPLRWELRLEDESREFNLELSGASELRQEASIKLEKRGEYRWRYLRVDTNRPFGLYRAWIYYPVEATSFAYPKLMSNVQVWPNGRDSDGEISQDLKGNEDFRGMAAYQEGESRRISWKHYARSGELLIKEGEELKIPSVDLVLTLPGQEKDRESYLSHIATQMVECQRRQIPFSLKGPGVSLAPAGHLMHLHDCLKVLAQC